MRPHTAHISRPTSPIALVVATLTSIMGLALPALGARASPTEEVPPTARQAMGMTWDGTNIVLFGGTEDGGAILGDTWTWNGSSWTPIDTGNNAPCPRHSHRMAWDSVRNEVVLFGGTGSGNCLPGGGPRNDTWIWNGAARTWRECQPCATRPSRRSSMGLASTAPGSG